MALEMSYTVKGRTDLGENTQYKDTYWRIGELLLDRDARIGSVTFRCYRNEKAAKAGATPVMENGVPVHRRYAFEGDEFDNVYARLIGTKGENVVSIMYDFAKKKQDVVIEVEKKTKEGQKYTQPENVSFFHEAKDA